MNRERDRPRRVAYWPAVRKLSAGPALILAAWLLPLAAQVGTLLQLLDAGGSAHPASMVELLVHGHPHGRTRPRARTLRLERARRTRRAASAAGRPPAVARAFRSVPRFALSDPRAGRLAAAERALAAAPLRHLLLVVLLR